MQRMTFWIRYNLQGQVIDEAAEQFKFNLQKLYYTYCSIGLPPEVVIYVLKTDEIRHFVCKG